MAAMLMKVLAVRAAETTYPTGDRSFAVLQCFPAAFPPEESDPFLMCDEFGPKPSDGISGPDEFPVDWHPHRGQDLLTYMLRGFARHADSMGNRETVAAPGMQWMQAGSGIEHAEGGGTPKGVIGHGFQIWINVPSSQKMSVPAYGTVPSDRIPVHETPTGATVRVIAGEFSTVDGDGGSTGPFITRVPALMLDVVVTPHGSFEHTVPIQYDNCIIYAYGDSGKGRINGNKTEHGHAVRLDATDADARTLTLEAGAEGLSVLIFAGKRLNQPVAWHGPFVMTTDEEIRNTLREYRAGTFLKTRAAWDYKRIADAPPEVREKVLAAAAAVVKDEL